MNKFIKLSHRKSNGELNDTVISINHIVSWHAVNTYTRIYTVAGATFVVEECYNYVTELICDPKEVV